MAILYSGHSPRKRQHGWTVRRVALWPMQTLKVGNGGSMRGSGLMGCLGFISKTVTDQSAEVIFKPYP